jgi:hypothetical protein
MHGRRDAAHPLPAQIEYAIRVIISRIHGPFAADCAHAVRDRAAGGEPAHEAG